MKGATHCFKPKKDSLKRRICLRCDEEFLSSGPHHRRCDKCSQWISSQESPYADGNFLYVIEGDDAESIKIKRAQHQASANHLRKGASARAP